MPAAITLSEADIDLLREACMAKGGEISAPKGDILRGFARTVSATHLTRLGYLEATEAGWRIKPALRAQVKALLKAAG